MKFQKSPPPAFSQLGTGAPSIFWGHGWGQTRAGLLPLAQALEKNGTHFVLDFPGFGETPPPPEDWGTAEYADHIADFIRTHSPEKIIWVGHSFGCRVGLQLAARHPDLIAGLCLIAGAGLPRKRPLWQKIYFDGRVKLYKALKKLIPFGLPETWLIKQFGSPDYLNAGHMRKILVRVINQDLTEIAKKISCPVLLIYGSEDTETPPEIGQRLHALIPSSELVILNGFDHYSILREAQHQVIHKLKGFILKAGKTILFVIIFLTLISSLSIGYNKEENVLAVTHHIFILAFIANIESFSESEFLTMNNEEKPINAGVTIYRGKPNEGSDGRLVLDVYNAKLY